MQPVNWSALPLEIRLQIYELATAYHLGRHLVKDSGGRLQYRLAWPLSPLDYRSPLQLQVDAMAKISRQARVELMPMIMRGFIVKFPAWTPDFKVQCLHWIEDVSELFCKCMDWIWLEGLYWRFSVHFRTPKTRTAESLWEDASARAADVHRREESETIERARFVLRVDCARHVRDMALTSGKKTASLIDTLLDEAGGDDRLGRDQIRSLLKKTALTGFEQMRQDEGGVGRSATCR